jgi:uncharacterized protein YcfJ
MNKAALALSALSMFLIGNADAFEAVADVVSVTPIYESVNQPTQNCWTESQESAQAVAPPHQQHSVVGAVIGGVVGGLIGSRFGEGNGRVAMAAVGAGVGAVAGDRVGAESSGGGATGYTTTTPVQRCQEVDHYDTRVSGYTVVYEYEGRRYTTTLPYNPGNQLRVNVAAAPK